jgi:hypothetical protein
LAVDVEKWKSFAGVDEGNVVVLFNPTQMKPLLTLTLAVVASLSCLARTESPPGDFGGATFADTGRLPVVDTGRLLVADSAQGSTVDSGRMPLGDSGRLAMARVVPFPDAINAVLGDFPYNLKDLTGELLMAEPEVDRYASLVSVREAEKCEVMRFHSVEDTTAGWQARMFSGGDFEEAARKYRQLFGMLQTCYVRLPDSSIYFLVGKWEPARQEVGFTTSTLRLRTNDYRYRHVVVELGMLYQVTDWAIDINIITKPDDDAVGAR